MKTLISLLFFSLTSAYSVFSQQIKYLNLKCNDIEYLKSTDQFLASTMGSQNDGNQILFLNPTDGSIERKLYLGSLPNQIALSANERYLFCTLAGEHVISRFDLENNLLEKIPIPNNEFASDIIATNEVGDFAVITQRRIYIFRDDQVLPESERAMNNRFAFIKDSSIWSYGFNITPGGFNHLLYDDDGVTSKAWYSIGGNGNERQIELLYNQKVFSNRGYIIDFGKTPPIYADTIDIAKGVRSLNQGAFAVYDNDIFFVNTSDDLSQIIQYDTELNRKSEILLPLIEHEIQKMVAADTNRFAFITQKINDQTATIGLIRICESEIDTKPQIVQISDATCKGDTLILTSDHPGAQALWSTGINSDTIRIMEDVSISVRVADSKGCFSAPSDTLTHLFDQVPNHIANFDSIEVLCPNDSLSLAFLGSNISAIWSTGDTMRYLNVKKTGTYHVQVISHKGCPGDSFSVDVIPPTIPSLERPGIEVIHNKNFCEGDNIVLFTQNQGYRSLWSNTQLGNRYLVPAEETKVYVEVIDENFCPLISSDTFFISRVRIPSPNFEYNGTSLQVNVQGDVQWYLDGQKLDGQESKSIVPSSPGMYTVAVNNQGCKFYPNQFFFIDEMVNRTIQSISITNPRYPTKEASNDQDIIIKGRVGDLIEIKNTEHQSIFKMTLLANTFSLKNVLKNLPSGEYMISLSNHDGLTITTQPLKK